MIFMNENPMTLSVLLQSPEEKPFEKPNLPHFHFKETNEEYPNCLNRTCEYINAESTICEMHSSPKVTDPKNACLQSILRTEFSTKQVSMLFKKSPQKMFQSSKFTDVLQLGLQPSKEQNAQFAVIEKIAKAIPMVVILIVK